MDIKQAIQTVIDSKDLTEQEMMAVANTIMSGEATDSQIGGLLVALRMKGETLEEITGFARVMREKATRIETRNNHLVDTCGTGGDKSGTFNISTISALVAAGAGCSVAKHGNRSVSSQCGSADVLKALGVNLELSPEQVGQCIDETGIGFLFAPMLHSAMKYAIGPRREMGVRTIFNVLGPLTNPAGAKRQLMGVFDGSLTEPLAHVLKELDSEHVMIVHGEDGLDEITLTGNTRISELKDGSVVTYDIHPEDFGFKTCSSADLKGGDPASNAEIAKRILRGEKGAKRDVVLMNAGAVIYTGGKADSYEAGIEIAAETIDNGKAMDALERLVALSNKN